MGYCPFSVGFRSTKIVHLLIEVIQTLCIGSATCEIVILDNNGSRRRFGWGGKNFNITLIESIPIVGVVIWLVVKLVHYLQTTDLSICLDWLKGVQTA